MFTQECRNITHVAGGVGGIGLFKVKFAAVNLAKNGDRAVVAAVVGKKIRVLGMHLVGSAGDGTALFTTATGGTAISGVVTVDIDVAQPLANLESEFGLFETVAGEGLYCTLSANMDLDGVISYVEV
jgi:hypothetical protein